MSVTQCISDVVSGAPHDIDPTAVIVNPIPTPAKSKPLVPPGERSLGHNRQLVRLNIMPAMLLRPLSKD